MIHGQIDEIAEADTPLAQLASPSLDALDQQGDAAQASNEGLLGRLDALGQCDLVFTRKQLAHAQLPEIGVDQIPREARLADRDCTVVGRARLTVRD